MGAVFPHTDRLQALLDALPDLLLRHTHILRAEADVLVHDRTDDLIVRILKHHPGSLTDLPQLRLIPCILAVDVQCPFGRRQNRIDVLRKRRLAGAIMSENCNKISRLHVEIYIIDGSLAGFDLAFLIKFQIFKREPARLDYIHIKTSFTVSASICLRPALPQKSAASRQDVS